MANRETVKRVEGHKPGQAGAKAPLGLAPEVAEEVRGLLAATAGDLYTAYLQIKGHHWTVEGAEYRDLHLFLDEVATDLLKGVDEAAERLADLGGTPPETAAAIQEASAVEPTVDEARGRGVRARLTADRALLQGVIDNLRDRITRAFDLREHATRHLLDRLLARVEKHAGDMDAFLAPDSLTR
ncbi:MAG TPA: ferritin-like domain-containing protein [Thermodesulfobacteriota bacterium]